MCQHKAPHREWAPALRHLGHDSDRKYPEPATLFDDYAGRGKAEHDQDMTIAKTMNADGPQARRRRRSLTPEQRKAWDAYYEPRNEAFRKAEPRRARTSSAGSTTATCTTTSAASRRSTRASAGCSNYLDDEGLAENTIVVYASDQGFYLGEHGWFDKRWIFEESLRTPLLVRWPGVTKPGSVNDRHRLEPRLRRDVPRRRRRCRSRPRCRAAACVPLLKGQTPADWRKSFYYHYYEYPGPHNVRPHYGVVTDRYKLVHFYEPEIDDWELFDLENDPNELGTCSAIPSRHGSRRSSSESWIACARISTSHRPTRPEA